MVLKPSLRIVVKMSQVSFIVVGLLSQAYETAIPYLWDSHPIGLGRQRVGRGVRGGEGEDSLLLSITRCDARFFQSFPDGQFILPLGFGQSQFQEKFQGARKQKKD